MANNVFGDPVTDETVKKMHPNKVDITAKDRAEAVLISMTTDGKAEKVNNFVQNLKNTYGSGTSTLCAIYNATGGNLTFALKHNWEGEVWESPYPGIIQNGQWAGFLHVSTTETGHSKEAIVYSGRNNDGDGRDWMLAWNTSRLDLENRVYTEIREKGHYSNVNWACIDTQMEKQTNNHSDTWNGCYSTISVGEGSSPKLEAIMTLSALDPKCMAVTRDVGVVSKSLDSK